MGEKIKDAANRLYPVRIEHDAENNEYDLNLRTRDAFTAGANFMLEELSKGYESLEYIEYWVTDHTDNSGYTVETKDDPKSFGACNYHHMIDIAALKSANAKIAELTQRNQELAKALDLVFYALNYGLTLTEPEKIYDLLDRQIISDTQGEK